MLSKDALKGAEVRAPKQPRAINHNENQRKAHRFLVNLCLSGGFVFIPLFAGAEPHILLLNISLNLY
jgi:hypothetical protein